jgi:dTDP-glucose pyrophosphorylase
MWGIVPAAGNGSRIQPLAFSKELLPVGSRYDGATERPRAVSEYLLERMLLAGVDKICIVISPGKTDIIQYYGGSIGGAHISYTVQPRPLGLCDAIFRALPLLHPREQVIVGLPDTIWFPHDGLTLLPDHVLSFLLFPVSRPELFDAVIADESGRVESIQVKSGRPASHWIWGAFKMPVSTMADLHDLWIRSGQHDEYVGGLVNLYLGNGGAAVGIRAGTSYVDVGTLHGYREAINLLSNSEGAANGIVLDGQSGVDERIKHLTPQAPASASLHSKSESETRFNPKRVSGR